jgi:hypothetical protein
MSFASQGATPGAARPGAGHDLARAAACVLITFVAFLPSLRNGFVETWDDGTFIVGNSIIRQLDAATVREAFLGTKAHYFAPLTYLSYALDYKVWGLDPFGFHLTNAILHALNAGLAFLVALGVLASAGLAERTSRWGALVAALAWALHPLRVESVAWATERKDVLSLLFGLAAILAYLGHGRSGAPFWRSRGYAAALTLFCLSLLAKPALVTLPLVLVILDAYPLGRLGRGRWGTALVEKLPLVGIAAAASVHFTAASHAQLTLSLAEVGVVSRILIAIRSIWEHALDWAWPAGLSPFYLHPGAVTLGDPSYLLPAAIVLVVTGVAVVKARRHPAFSASWLTWLVALAPGLMAAQVSWVGRADRFTYFAALPLTVVVAAAAAQGLERLAPRARVAAAAGLVAGVALLAGLTVRQISFWHDDVSLWSRPIAVSPRLSGRVYTERSQARERLGDLNGARADMDDAIAIASSKNYAFIYTLYSRRARILAEIGRLREAADDYGRAIQADASPGVAETLRERSDLYMAMGETALADADRRLADQLDGTP